MRITSDIISDGAHSSYTGKLVLFLSAVLLQQPLLRVIPLSPRMKFHREIFVHEAGLGGVGEGGVEIL